MKVSIDLGFGAAQNFPSGTVLTSYDFSLDGTTQNVLAGDLPAVFNGVPAGTYACVVQAKDQNGAALGNSISANITVTDLGVNIALPDLISPTVSPDGP